MEISSEDKSESKPILTVTLDLMLLMSMPKWLPSQLNSFLKTSNCGCILVLLVDCWNCQEAEEKQSYSITKNKQRKIKHASKKKQQTHT
jgi:tRNA(Met) C34 N-acetyltransferase TmcA